MVVPSTTQERREFWNNLSPRNQEILRMFNNGYRQSEIARRYDLSRQRIMQMVNRGREQGLVAPKRKRIRPSRKSASASSKLKCNTRPDNSERNRIIIALVQRGKTHGEIKKELNLSRSTICSVVYRHQQKQKKQGETNPKQKPVPKLGRTKTKRLPKYPDVMDFKI